MRTTWAGTLALLLTVSTVRGHDPANPLKPPDRSSPRATLETFLETGDALGAFLAREYLPSPTRAGFWRLSAFVNPMVECLDLSGLPPAARVKTGRSAAFALYVTLSRVRLPPPGEIPTPEHLAPSAGTNTLYWVIPDTEITLERVPTGSRRGQFLFSADTVARATVFHNRVRDLPYTREVPLRNLSEILAVGGGWLIPHAWIRALPASFQATVGGQAVWKWVGLVLLTVAFVLVLRGVCRLSCPGRTHPPLLHASTQLVLPIAFLLALPGYAYLALVQLSLGGGVGSAIRMCATGAMFLAGAWVTWRAAPVLAEAIIASPRIAPESIDAHLIRICSRLLGIVAGVVLLTMGADRLGLPLYGIIAGLGVGGLAIALAAQPTIENLIGGLSLFADRPVRVGDLCQYGTEQATVEAIGIRSTRIRGLDRTLTTIPNAEFSKMSVVNLSARDRILIRAVLGIRFETTPDQLRNLLVRIREMLLGHPRIDPDPARARFVGFGDSSLDIEVFAYAMTRDRQDFLAIQEDVLLRAMDIIKECGTDLAYPSQTIHFTRDTGLDPARAAAAEAEVRCWREEGRLPFPDFTREHAQRIRGTLAYPPPGSSTGTRACAPASLCGNDTDQRPASPGNEPRK